MNTSPSEDIKLQTSLSFGMSKKIFDLVTVFDLINSDFRQMSTCTSLLHILSSSEFWSFCRVLYITCQNTMLF